ncbi:MAG: PQQ-like beta-propeller repeat protein, partial [Actinobacteria bacterium]|nr:PQQ-like beta-propeller repeat protein [Actinomycetota bacterium]
MLGTILVLIVVIVVAFLFLFHGNAPSSSSSTSTSHAAGSSTSGSGSTAGSSSGATTTVTSGITMPVAPIPSTTPSAFKLSTGVYKGTTKITGYERSDPIDFGPGKDYTTLPGIITFRGNNYRESASYGTANVQTGKLEILWSALTGSTAKTGGTGSWTGSGWTGQPLIVKWPNDLKSIMNISAAKKADPNLVEVIYPCLDGNIYFLDLKDGTKTRPTIKSGGGPFKGTGSIYPDGTPILFVGHGDNSPGKEVVKARLYSLLDQKLLYTFGKKPDPNSFRKFHAYDSSALFDVGTDTIIEPGENGLLYTIKLNTNFDKAAGTLSIHPDAPIKMRYTAPNYSDATENLPSSRWWGMEDSAVIWHNYMYVADNGGKLMAIDLNTMKAVWVQNVLDDTNTSPVFEESLADNTGYIYISTSLHITAKSGPNGRTGGIPIWKINAATGEIVWKSAPYE